MLTRFSQSLLRPGGGWAQPFCRALELPCHFVVNEKPFCRMGGLVLLQNEWLRPHRGNWKGDGAGGPFLGLHFGAGAPFWGFGLFLRLDPETMHLDV